MKMEGGMEGGRYFFKKGRKRAARHVKGLRGVGLVR